MNKQQTNSALKLVDFFSFFLVLGHTGVCGFRNSKLVDTFSCHMFFFNFQIKPNLLS